MTMTETFLMLTNMIIEVTSYWNYEVKIKMFQEQWLQLKMKFLMVYDVKIVISVED